MLEQILVLLEAVGVFEVANDLGVGGNDLTVCNDNLMFLVRTVNSDD
jgi:hypothetical protein